MPIPAMLMGVIIVSFLNTWGEVTWAHAGTPGKNNILFIFSWHKKMPWQTEIETGFETHFNKASSGANIFYEYLDAGRFKGKKQIDIFKNYLSQKYADQKIDDVIFESSLAARLSFSYPELFSASKKYIVNPGPIPKGTDIDPSSIVQVHADYDRAAREILRVSHGYPIILVAGATSGSRQRVEVFSNALLRRNPGQKIRALIGLPMPQLLEEVAHIDERSVIFYLLMFQDIQGAHYIPYQAVSQICQTSRAPVYSLWTSLLGSGIVGGYMLSGALVGKQVAALLIHPDLSFQNTASQDQFHGFFYDWRQLKRWQIDKISLPVNSTILFKEHPFYRHYYMEIIVCALSVILLISFFWNRLLKREFQDRIRAEHNLLESQTRFRALSEAAFEGIAITRDNTVVEANTNLSQMFGYKFKEVIHMKAADFVIPEDRTSLKESVGNDLGHPFELTGIRKDGSQFALEVQGKKILYQGHETSVVVLRDLTERKKSEEEIKTLRGLLPICSICKKIRDDEGYWNHLESYISKHSNVVFSHGICDDCMEKKYPEPE